MLFVRLKKAGGGFDLMDKWSQERSSLSHDILSSNYFKWSLTPGRSGYAEAAIKGIAKDAFPLDERTDFQKTKERLDAWPEIKSKVLNLSNRVMTEFNPYLSGFDALSTFMSKDELQWFGEVIRYEVTDRCRLEQWKTDIESAVKKIDSEFNNIRTNKATIEELRSAVDNLIDIFSGKGYFRDN
jgi:hypothetical protein